MLMKIPDYLSITLLSKRIISSKSAKNLGVITDCSLTYDEHVTQITSKCIGRLCQINRVKYVFDRRTVPLKGKLTVSTRFSKLDSRVAKIETFEFRDARVENRESRIESREIRSSGIFMNSNLCEN